MQWKKMQACGHLRRRNSSLVPVELEALWNGTTWVWRLCGRSLNPAVPVTVASGRELLLWVALPGVHQNESRFTGRRLRGAGGKVYLEPRFGGSGPKVQPANTIRSNIL